MKNQDVNDAGGASVEDSEPMETKAGNERCHTHTLAESTLAGALPGLIERLEQGVRRVSTGWPLLDKALRDDERDTQGGFVYPSVVVLGAQPKIGKSTWAQIVTERFIARDETCHAYVLDLENGQERYMRRLLYRRAKVGSLDLKRGMTSEQHRQWGSAKAWVTSDGRRIHFEPHPRGLNPTSFLGRVDELRSLAGDEAELLVVIDSLQKLPGELGDRRATIDGWLRAIEGACDDYGCLVLVVSELKRDGKGYEPGLTAFKESGDIEYTAHLALCMGRKVDDLNAPAELNVVASRDGTVGSDCVAAYQTVYPWHGMDETPVEPKRVRQGDGKGGAYDPMGDE